MTTKIGTLDRRMTIQRATVTLNEFNEPVETWSDHARVWTRRRDASATESYRAQEVGAQITARFTVRWSSQTEDLNPRDRLSFDGRLYNITAVRDVGRNRWREIDAVARADEAAPVVP
jgi:SPP1 family predicted phage head-tail adaptor